MLPVAWRCLLLRSIFARRSDYRFEVLSKRHVAADEIPWMPWCIDCGQRHAFIRSGGRRVKTKVSETLLDSVSWNAVEADRQSNNVSLLVIVEGVKKRAAWMFLGTEADFKERATSGSPYDANA